LQTNSSLLTLTSSIMDRKITLLKKEQTSITKRKKQIFRWRETGKPARRRKKIRLKRELSSKSRKNRPKSNSRFSKIMRL